MTLPTIADALRRCAGEALSLQRALERARTDQERDLTATIRRLRGLAADLETTARTLERQARQQDERREQR